MHSGGGSRAEGASHSSGARQEQVMRLQAEKQLIRRYQWSMGIDVSCDDDDSISGRCQGHTARGDTVRTRKCGASAQCSLTWSSFHSFPPSSHHFTLQTALPELVLHGSCNLFLILMVAFIGGMRFIPNHTLCGRLSRGSMS